MEDPLKVTVLDLPGEVTILLEIKMWDTCEDAQINGLITARNAHDGRLLFQREFTTNEIKKLTYWQTYTIKVFFKCPGIEPMYFVHDVFVGGPSKSFFYFWLIPIASKPFPTSLVVKGSNPLRDATFHLMLLLKVLSILSMQLNERCHSTA